MTYISDFPSQANSILIDQIAAATTATTLGASTADMILGDGRCLAQLIAGPGLTGNTPLDTVGLQESTDGTTWTNVLQYSIGTTSTSSAVQFGTSAMTNGLYEVVGFTRTKRYVRNTHTITGTGTLAIPISVLVSEQLKVLN